MAANVLNSERAVAMSVFVVRAFLKMRQTLVSRRELAQVLGDLEKKLTARLDGHDAAIGDVLQRIMRLLDPAPEPEPPRRQIGFHVKPESEANSKAKGRKKWGQERVNRPATTSAAALRATTVPPKPSSACR